MTELEREKFIGPTAEQVECWLHAQSELDWARVGLPPLSDWDPALLAVLRMSVYAPSPMLLLVGHEGIVIANDAARQLFAIKASAGSFNGRAVADVLPAYAPLWKLILTRAQLGETTALRDEPIRTPASDGDEQLRWFHLDFMPVLDSANGFLGSLGMVCDVTDHIQRIHELSDSEERLRLALDGSGMVGVWTLDVALGLSTADVNVARAYGLSEEDCKNGIDDSLFFDAIHPDDRERVQAAFEHAVVTRSSYQNKYRVIGRDGKTRWVITSAKPSIDGYGEVTRMLGVVIDVTNQMETASALAESRFRFQTLTEALPQIVWSCAADGAHDYFSKRWSEFTGIAPENIVEETWKELVFPDHWPTVSDVWDAALRSGEPYDIDYRFRHHSGEYRWLRVMALPIRDDDGKVIRWFGTSTDVHDAYLLAEQREKLADELVKIATVDHLTQVLTRRAFIDRASAFLDAGAAAEVSMLMLDIDHFKSINDTYGHAGGDCVLVYAAKRVQACLKQHDLIGRLGGEEFAVLLPGCAVEQAHQVAHRILHLMQRDPFKLEDGQQVSVTVSIGMTTGAAGANSLDELLMIADQALYGAKNGGRNRAVFSSAQTA